MILRVDTLLGYQLTVVDEEVEVEPDPRANGDAEPRTERIKVLVMIDPRVGHTIRLPLLEDARRAVVDGLTGGIVVP